MRATLLTIGDELLIGQVVNTNAAWIGEELHLLGVDLDRVVTLGDDAKAIRDELDRAWHASDLIIVTGGLGPTHDDITREVVAEYFGVTLRLDPGLFETIRSRYERRGRTMPESNRRQAMVPVSFDVLPNPIGTAPGLWRRADDGHVTRLLVVLPGVPREMKTIFRQEVVPRLRRERGLRAIVHRTLRTAGIAESLLQEKIGDLSSWLGPSLRLAYLPSTTQGVRLRLTGLGASRESVERQLDDFEAYLRERIGRYVYGVDGEDLEVVVGRLLKEQHLWVAVAESCTGGLVLNRLTDVPGSSAYVRGGVVAYDNRVKIEALGVETEALAREGAVSEIVARQMARGVRERLGADIGLSTTGVAGPTGGTPEKPVGTVWIGYADADGDAARLLRLVDDRAMNKELASTAVLEMLRRRLVAADALADE